MPSKDTEPVRLGKRHLFVEPQRLFGSQHQPILHRARPSSLCEKAEVSAKIRRNGRVGRSHRLRKAVKYRRNSLYPYPISVIIHTHFIQLCVSLQDEELHGRGDGAGRKRLREPPSGLRRRCREAGRGSCRPFTGRAITVETSKRALFRRQEDVLPSRRANR